MSHNIGDGWYGAVKLMLTVVAITIPLALWKLVEIIIWLWRNVSVTVGGQQ